MFERIRKKISKKDPEEQQDDLKSTIVKDIISLGDKGVECALKHERIPTEMAMNRLDSLRLTGEEKGLDFVVTTSTRQLDRIMEAKKEW